MAFRITDARLSATERGLMIEFNVAAEAAGLAEDEDVFEVPIEDEVYIARRPTTAQGALLNVALSGTGVSRLSAVFSLLEGLIGEEGRAHIERLVWERRVDLDDLVGGSEQNPEGGLIDQIFEAFSERPSQPSTDSSSSRATGGRRSTGRSPGKGSTRSPSPSTAS
jgi:hypothetical protein